MKVTKVVFFIQAVLCIRTEGSWIPQSPRCSRKSVGPRAIEALAPLLTDESNHQSIWTTDSFAVRNEDTKPYSAFSLGQNDVKMRSSQMDSF